MNFRVGQKVVRVNSSGLKGPLTYRGSAPFNYPNIGEVCTVKTINHWSHGTLITLAEHDNSHLTTNGWEPGFDARAFRPVVKRKTDISIFTKMLTPSKEPVRT